MSRENQVYLALLVIIIALVGYVLESQRDKASGELETIVLNEVVRSAFYAPQYVALSEGYFEENGLSVELITGNGADKSMTSLLTGESDIILAGAESSMYIKAEDSSKDVVNIAQLTKRAGNFLIARDETTNFSWEDVKGKTIIGGRPGGMPEIMLEHILKENGIDPVKDVTIVTNLDFTATAGAFATGDYDYTVEFEPNATKIEGEGYGKVVASLGVDGGEVPYTSYITTQAYAEENKENVENFLAAVKKGQEYINTHSSEEVADSIIVYFDNITKSQLVNIIDRYRYQDTWNTTLVCNEESYEKLQQILLDAGTLSKGVDLETLINNYYADKLGGE